MAIGGSSYGVYVAVTGSTLAFFSSNISLHGSYESDLHRGVA